MKKYNFKKDKFTVIKKAIDPKNKKENIKSGRNHPAVKIANWIA